MTKLDGPIDYAVFQLSPRRSRCELLISRNGNTEKLASGLIKPFVSELKVAEEQFARMAQYIKLEVGKGKHGESHTWFTRETLERFVRFVTTPEILDLATSFDAEMSQLEAAQKIYLQGQEYQHSVSSGEDEAGIALAADATKKELLRAIDVRLGTVQQQLIAACARAYAAGFHSDSVSELLLFADCFRAVRLNEACTKFLSLCQRRPGLLPMSTKITEEQIRSSCESDMSLDDLTEDFSIPINKQPVNKNCSSTYQESFHYEKDEIIPDQSKASMSNQPESSSSFSTERKNDKWTPEENAMKFRQSDLETIQTSLPTRRLSVQDRISLFESKQKENVSGGCSKPVVGKTELRRLSSDIATSPLAVEKAFLRRWSGTSDMSIDLSADKKDYGDSSLCTPPSMSDSPAEGHGASDLLEDRNLKGHHGGAGSPKFDGNILKAEIFVSLKEEKSLTSAHFSGKEEGSTAKECFAMQDSSSSQAKHSIRKQHRRTNYEENAEEKARFLSESGGGKAKQEVDCEVQLMTSAQENDVVGVGNQAASSSNALNCILNGGVFPRKGETRRTIDSDRPKDPLASSFKIRGVHGHSKSLHLEQLQRAKQSKGSQELNYELKMKATELEKLFVEHKLRIPSDQSSSARRNKAADLQKESMGNLLMRKVPSTEAALSSLTEKSMVPEARFPTSSTSSFLTPPTKIAYSEDSGSTLRRNFSDLSCSDESKGKFYEKYMKKRDAKLREDWGSKKAEKEAKLKAMHDRLEQSTAEMKAKFSGSADQQQPSYTSGHRTERARSFNGRSALREQVLSLRK